MFNFNYTSDQIMWSHGKMPPNTEHSLCHVEIRNKIQESPDISYKINSSGHRSDEFSNNHIGKHILFAGCSITFGEGLPYMKNWSGRLYEKISKVENLSGYYNLSYLGGSTQIIIENIYRYIALFGKPEYIFCHLPETKRYIEYFDDEERHGYYNFINKDYNHKGFINNYLSIRSFELYCESNGIKLYWTCWDETDSQKLLNANGLNRLININDAHIYSSAKNKEEKGHRYYKISREPHHPGYMYSDGLANIFFERYLNEKN